MRSLANSVQQTSGTLDHSWRAILECAAVEVFEMMAGVRLEVDPAPAEHPSGEQTAMVGIAGALCGMITLRCSEQTSLKLASLMLGGDRPPTHTTACDALGELCNMVAGNFKSKINALKDRCMLSVPTVITGEDYAMEAADPNQGFTVALTFDGEPVWVCLIAHT